MTLLGVYTITSDVVCLPMLVPATAAMTCRSQKSASPLNNFVERPLYKFPKCTVRTELSNASTLHASIGVILLLLHDSHESYQPLMIVKTIIRRLRYQKEINMKTN